MVELDKIFWRSGLLPTPRDEWIHLQQKLVREEKWIMDGDLGPYDAVEERLPAADTIVLLDFSLPRCAWRALRRSRERSDFWRWVLTWRRRCRPVLMKAIANHAPGAAFRVLRDPKAVDRFISEVAEASRAST